MFSFHSKKMEQEAIYFGENGIIKSAFHKNKRHININEVDIEKEHCQIKNKSIKIRLNTLLDINMKVMLFHLHYV